MKKNFIPLGSYGIDMDMNKAEKFRQRDLSFETKMKISTYSVWECRYQNC